METGDGDRKKEAADRSGDDIDKEENERFSEFVLLSLENKIFKK